MLNKHNLNQAKMKRFSIQLIENHIDTTARLVTAISQHLAAYTLSIARNLDEAINEHEPAHVILLDIAHLSGDVAQKLSSLSAVYGNIPIVLITPKDDPTRQKILREALAVGASDYITLSEPGLLLLGRRLASLHQRWRSASTTVALSDFLTEAITKDTSELILQLISADNRIQAWNQASEKFFGLKKEAVIGRLVDELPLSAETLSRLKDMLDQARTTGQPFAIPLYTLESQHIQTRWVQVHVYPIHRALIGSTYKPELLTDICIVITRLPDTPALDSQVFHEREDLQILLEAGRELSGQLELEPTLEKAVEQVKSLLYGDNCQIYFIEKDNQTLRPVHAVGPLLDQIKTTSLSVGQGLIGEVATTGKAVLDNQAAAKITIPNFSDPYLLSAPLTALKGVMGVMVISRRQPPFTQEEFRFFESLVQQVSLAINNARLFEETRRSLSELAILYEASSAFPTHWDDQGVLSTLIQQMVQAIEVSRGFIASWNKEQNKSFIQAAFTNSQAYSQQPAPELDPTLDLKERATLLTMISQQRPVVLQLSNPSLDETERREMERYGSLSRLLIPLVAKGETIGWIELWETRHERIFTADEVRLSRALASQIAIALQNQNYMEQTQRTLEETMALYRVASALTTPQDPQGIISTVLQEYLQVLNLKQGSVILFDFVGKCGVVKVRTQDPQPVFPPISLLENNQETGQPSFKVLEGWQIPLQNNPVYERLMRTHEPVIIRDSKAKWLTTPPSFARSLHIPPVGGWADEEAFSILIIPIRIRGEIVGVIVAENTRDNRPFDQWDISTGQAMADQLGIGLQNVQLYEAEYRRREQAETLREVSAIVSSSLDLNEVLERILDQLGRVVKYDSAAIHLIEGDRRRVIAGRGFNRLEDHIGLTFPINPDANEPGAIAIQRRTPLVFSDIPLKYPVFKDPKHSHIRSWMGIPLIARNKAIGLISIDHAEPDAYTEEDIQLASAFANQVAIALENARLHDIEVRQLTRELELAQEIQERLLPQTIPQVPGLEIAGRIVPARQVGGDFFHFFSTETDQLGVAIGDVSGKGIPAALYMAASITAIDIQTGPNVTPGDLLNKLNAKLYNRLKENKMNIALQIATFVPLPSEDASVDGPPKASGSLMTAASAGMIAPIGATQHGCRLLPVGGLPIGALPASQHVYTDDIFLLDPFTTIIFTSDGIVEAQNEKGELFGFERLETTILEIITTRNAQAITDYIIQAAQNFTGSSEQHDDMTVVVVVKK
jgi:PAS domain S-box-containing protein